MNANQALELIGTNAEALFAFADYMMEKHNVSNENMSIEACEQLARIFLNNVDWITEAHAEALEIVAERKAA